MGLFDKVKSLFTEEIEEEIKPIKKEVRRIEVPTPTRTERTERVERNDREMTVAQPEQEKATEKEDKFVFFSDDDFKDLDKPKYETKNEIKEEKPLAYRGATPKVVVEEKKAFLPSLIISPVYGVLDKNYSKDDVVSKKVQPAKSYRSYSTMDVDDIRNKAYGTVEDELKNSLLGNNKVEEEYENDIDIFEELEKFSNLDNLEYRTSEKKNSDNMDNLLGELDNKKDEILDELDNKKDEILDVLDNKKGRILIEDNDDFDLELELDLGNSKIVNQNKYALDYDEEIDFADSLELDDDTLELSKQLESQKRKLDEINDFIEEEPKSDKSRKEFNDDDLNESELFNLIDSMYEKRDED